MNGRLNLKIFLSISFGLHVLFFSALTFVYPDLKINRLPPFNIEVSLIPLIPETKVVPKRVTNPELKVTRHEARIPIHEETPPLQMKKPEAPLVKEEQKPESIPAHTEMQIVPVSHSSLLPFEEPKSEIGSIKEEKTIVEPYGNPSPPPVSSEPSKMVMRNPSLFDGEILFVQPRYAENPKPIYPPEARKKGYEGEVILRVEVLQNGRVGQIEVKKSSGYELLDRSALSTVKRWKFIPAKKGETQIPLWVNIPIKFQLQ